jgi:hypothetical protein
MDQDVAEGYNLAKIRNLGRERCVESGELTKSLAENLKLALHRRAQDEIAVEISEAFAAVMSAMARAASRASQMRLLGSRLKDRLARALDALFEVGIANRARLNKVDPTAE